MSDSIAVLSAGKIMQVGSPAEIYYHPANKFVASFVGTVNFIEGEVVGVDASGGTDAGVEFVRITTKGAEILVDARKFNNTALRAVQESKKVLLVVRPESMKVVESAEDAANIFEGEVDHYIFEGSAIRYWIRALDSMIILDAFDSGETGVRSGTLKFRIDPSKVHLIAL